MPSCLLARRADHAPADVDSRTVWDTLTRFAFSVADGLTPKTKQKRREQVVEYVLDADFVADFLDEWEDGNRSWIVLQVSDEIAVGTAQRFAEACPHYVPGSFQVEKARLIRLGNPG